MAPKKKAPAKEEKADEDDLSTEQVWKAYRKNCTALDIPVNKRLKEMYEIEFVEDRKNFTKLHFWEELGWQGVKAIIEPCL